jgi:hypothetical protein
MSPDTSSNDEEDDPSKTQEIATGNATDNDDEVSNSPADDSYAFYDDDSFVVTPDMELAAREMDELAARGETNEWNQARQEAAAALQRAVDERERAVVPVGRPYPLDGRLHGTASERATQAQQADRYASEMLARVHDEAVANERAQQAQRTQRA